MAQGIIMLTALLLIGPRSVFDSPAKPDKPSLRQPASQTFLFSRPQQSKVNFTRGSSFKTPRKIDLDFSSGAENPSSPDFADNDETPEKPSKSNRRDSLFNFYGRFAPSPGRGEIPRSNKFSNVLVNRVHKRRRREREIDRHLRRHSDDSIGDAPHGQRGSNSSQPKPTETPINHEIPFFSRLFTFLETHPHIPRILSYYAQFAFNLAIASITLYIIITFLLAIKGDFDNANTDASADILAEMSSCAKNFVENRCSGEEGRRLPALEVVCDNWERCMNRDPAKSRRVKVSAQTLAEIFNSFIEPIGFKTMVCASYQPVDKLIILTVYTLVLLPCISHIMRRSFQPIIFILPK